MAVSIERLRELADRLPRNPSSPVYHMAISAELAPRYRSYIDEHLLHQPVNVDRVTFRNREVIVEGVRCLAWFYHEVLVKVTV